MLYAASQSLPHPTSPHHPPQPCDERSCSSTCLCNYFFIIIFFSFFELQYRFLHLAFSSRSCKINRLFHLDLSGGIVQPSRRPLGGAWHVTWLLLLLLLSPVPPPPSRGVRNTRLSSIRSSELRSGRGSSKSSPTPPSDERSSLAESLWCCFKKKEEKWINKKNNNNFKEGVIPNKAPEILADVSRARDCWLQAEGLNSQRSGCLLHQGCLHFWDVARFDFYFFYFLKPCEDNTGPDVLLLLLLLLLWAQSL